MPDASITEPTLSQPVVAAKRRSGTSIVAGIVIAALLAVASVFIFRAATGPDPIAARVPASVSMYAQVTLQPSLEQKRLLADLVDGLPGGRDGMERSLNAMLDQILAPVAPSLDADAISPWVGDQVALVTWSPDADSDAQPVIVAHAKDPALARSAVDEINAGHAAVASLDAGFVTLGAFDADALTRFHAAVAAAPLSRDRAFKTARARVGGDGVLLLRGSLTGITERLGGAAVPGIAGTQIPDGTIVAGVRIVERGVRVTFAEASTIVDRPLPIPDDLSLLHELANHAHAAIGFHDVASLLRAAIEAAPGEQVADLESRFGLDLEQDVLSWLGDEVAVSVASFGAKDRHATIAIEASDEDAMRSFIGTVRGFLAISQPDGATVEGTDDDTFTVHTDAIDATVSMDGTRLTIQIDSTDAASSMSDAPLLRGLPDDDASFAGAINIGALAGLSPFGEVLTEAGPLGVYGPALDALGFDATRDEIGPLFSFTLLFKDVA